MKAILLTLASLTGVLCALPALASQNQPPVCHAKTLALGAQPKGATLTWIAIEVLKTGACADPDGDTLTLVSASPNVKLNDNQEVIASYPAPNESITFTFTVTDGKGGEATGTLTLTE